MAGHAPGDVVPGVPAGDGPIGDPASGPGGTSSGTGGTASGTGSGATPSGVAIRESRLRRVARPAGRVGVALFVLAACYRALAEPLAAEEPTRANAVLVRGQDFRDATYFPVKELLRGGVPYDPQSMFTHWPVRQEFDLYAPFHLLLQLPFALAPYRPAIVAFSCASLVYLLLIGLVSARVLRLPGGWTAAWAVGGLVVSAQFGKSVVYFGQIDPLVGLGGVLALLFAGRRTRGAPAWAALGLALAWTKPQFGIPLTLILLARGTWRPAVYGTLGAGLASLPVVGVLVVRAGGVGGLLDVVSRNLDYANHQKITAVDAVESARVDAAAVFFRLTGVLPPGAQLVVFVVVLGLVGWLLSRPGRRGLPLDVPELALAALAVCVGIVKQQSESLVTVPALVGVVVLVLARRRPAWPVLGATALMWIPVVHVTAVAVLLVRYGGWWTERIVEGLALNLAFWLVAAHVIAHRSEPARPLPAGDAPW